MDAKVFWNIRDWADAAAEVPIERELLVFYLFEPQSVLGDPKHPQCGDREPYGSKEDRSA